MLSKSYLRNRQRKNKSDPSSLQSQTDLLRAILENLEYANELSTLHTQYFLLETDACSALAGRDKKKQLLRTMQKFVEQSTEGDEYVV